jgi:peptidyl-prolyl cis-trans isomerase SurA
VNLTRALFAGSAIALGLGSGALAQQSAQPDQLQAGGQPQVNSTQSLRLPQNPQLFGTAMPSVVKATAIVNGDVITQTDVQQRLAFLAMANGGQIPPDEVDRLRDQVLRNLIDETLEIQSARTEKI